MKTEKLELTPRGANNFRVPRDMVKYWGSLISIGVPEFSK